jgi:hypothetical protein
MSTLTELGTEFRTLYDKKEALNEELKELNKKLTYLREVTLPRAMSEAEIEKFTVDGIGSFHIQQQIKAHIPTDLRPEVYAWLTEKGHGELITPYVWPATFNAWAKEQIINGGELPEMVDPKYVPTAMMRRK